jgi:hypothetical protein
VVCMAHQGRHKLTQRQCGLHGSSGASQAYSATMWVAWFIRGVTSLLSDNVGCMVHQGHHKLTQRQCGLYGSSGASQGYSATMWVAWFIWGVTSLLSDSVGCMVNQGRHKHTQRHWGLHVSGGSQSYSAILRVALFRGKSNTHPDYLRRDT